MESEEYEILPHEELEALRKEVEYLKRNPLGDTKQADDLKSSIDQLTESIHALLNLLTSVNKDMTEDYKNMTVNNHFSHLAKQNETIAQGLVSIAELIKKNHKEDLERKEKEEEEKLLNSVPQVTNQNATSNPFSTGNQYNIPGQIMQPGGMSNYAPVSTMRPGLASPPMPNDILPMPQPSMYGQDMNTSFGQNYPPPNNMPPPPPESEHHEEKKKKGGLFRFK